MPLKLWLYAILVFTAAGLVYPAEEKPKVFYVQVIRGTNDKKPPEPKAKLVGPKLSQMLIPVFRWKYYWEVSRHEVKINSGKRTKQGLQGRDVEFQLTADKLDLRLFQKGKLVRTARQKLGGDWVQIMGGVGEGDNAWFVVVRQDKPQ